jgi:hypothetical protein
MLAPMAASNVHMWPRKKQLLQLLPWRLSLSNAQSLPTNDEIWPHVISLGLFLQADNPDFVLMCFDGIHAELMAKVAPKLYCKYTTTNAKGKPVLYVQLEKAPYGMMKSFTKTGLQILHLWVSTSILTTHVS